MPEGNKPSPSEEEMKLEKEYKEKQEKQKQEEKMKLEIEADLRTNPRYKPFFEQYRPSSVESFITDYPKDKIRWLGHGSWRLKQTEQHSITYYSMAEDCLWEVQQKKLFDLQCKWRAEQITLEGVEICEDFVYWERNIKNCPFLPAVTSAEVEIYRQYLLSNNVELSRWTEWQNYQEIKEEYQQGGDVCDMPEWYEFHNSRTGAGMLMLLPDIRGEKEEFYLNLHYKTREKAAQKYINEQPEDEKKPYLSCSGETLEEFIISFEPRHILNCYNAYHQKGWQFAWDDNELTDAIETLLNAKKQIALSFNTDWREAILQTANRYEAEMISEIMPQAHQEYLGKIEMGILTEDMEAEPHPSKNETRQNWYNNILHGRELNGEPKDLNF